MSEHTPGPWRMVEPQADGLWGILGADGFPVVVLTTVRQPAEANARLIAAAPELLEIARAIYPLFLDGELYADHDRGTELLGQLRRAIAKAEGRES